MSFANLIASDRDNVFLNEDEFGEEVVLFPREDSTPRTFVANVERMEAERDTHSHHETDLEVTHVSGPNTATALAGVGVGWSIRLPEDGPSVRRAFARIVEKDAHWITARFEGRSGGRGGYAQQDQL